MHRPPQCSRPRDTAMPRRGTTNATEAKPKPESDRVTTGPSWDISADVADTCVAGLTTWCVANAICRWRSRHTVETKSSVAPRCASTAYNNIKRTAYLEQSDEKATMATMHHLLWKRLKRQNPNTPRAHLYRRMMSQKPMTPSQRRQHPQPKEKRHRGRGENVRRHARFRTRLDSWPDRPTPTLYISKSHDRTRRNGTGQKRTVLNGSTTLPIVENCGPNFQMHKRKCFGSTPGSGITCTTRPQKSGTLHWPTGTLRVPRGSLPTTTNGARPT